MSDLIGQEVAGFRILREIARGGMAVVLEAEQVRLGRPVALKMLHPTLTVDSDFLRRFEREAKTLARLNHENIVNVIDFFEHENRYFLALEFVEGETLSRRLRRCARQGRFFSVGEATAVAWQVAQALAFAHSRGIIHRDLKPDNIMLTSRGRAKVMDFGIARTLGGSADTEAGTRVGTPDYMAPEQLKGQSADARSDLFSLGVILYEMISGRRPYSQTDLLRSDRENGPEIVWDDGVLPPGNGRLRPILAKLLALEPERRYATANDLLQEMRQQLGVEFLGDEAWTTPVITPATEVVEEVRPALAEPPRRLWLKRAGVLVAVVLFAMGLLAYHRWQQGRFEEQSRRLEATMANFQAFMADSQGRVTEAESLFLRAIDVDPTVAHYWRDLGDFYVKYGHPEKAIHLYRKTLELDPSDDETARRIRSLEADEAAGGATTATLPTERGTRNAER
jgi:hypothetical protein